MSRVLLAALPFLSGSGLSSASFAANVAFPLALAGVECWAEYDGYQQICFTNRWTLEEVGTFSDQYLSTGTWEFRPEQGRSGALWLTYDSGWYGYVYAALREGTCVGGPNKSRMIDNGGPYVGDFWTACIDP